MKDFRYEKAGDGKLKIVFTTSDVESSMELLLSSVSLFSFDNLQDYESDLLVMRPLIAFNDDEVKEKLEMYSNSQ